MMQKTNIFNIGITNATYQEVLEYVVHSLEKTDETYYIVTPNPEILMHARKDHAFRMILNHAEIALPDGAGVMFAGQIMDTPFKERITGVDFMERLCSIVSKKPIKIGFLGAGPTLALKTAECLVSKYPGLQVVFAGEEWRKNEYQVSSSKYKVDKNKNIHNTQYLLPNTKIDILFVAFGFPKQEEWMANHIGKVPVRVMMGVGGAFDYISGRVSRAPYFLRFLGLEWLYRLIRQPWRLKRQTALIAFLLCLVREYKK